MFIVVHHVHVDLHERTPAIVTRLLTDLSVCPIVCLYVWSSFLIYVRVRKKSSFQVLKKKKTHSLICTEEAGT